MSAAQAVTLTRTPSGTRWSRTIALLIPVLLYVALRTVYFHNGVYWPSDSKWSVQTALSIVREGNTDLDEYSELIGEDGVSHDYTLRYVGGKIQTKYPIGASVLSVPYVAVLDRYYSIVTGKSLEHYLQDHSAGNIERLIASSMTALSMVVLYLLAKRHLHWWWALALAGGYGLATGAWSTAAIALWQHTPTLLLLFITLWLLDMAQDRPSRVQYAGFVLALAFVSRPTNALVIFGVTGYIALFYRRYLLRYLAWAAPVAIAFVAYSYSVYGHYLPDYYRQSAVATTSTFGEAIVGTLVSPNRGLFVWTPLVLWAFYGLYLRVRSHAVGRLEALSIILIVAHWLLISGWACWWGGYCMGPRFFTDVLPFYALLTIPALARLSQQRAIGKALVIVLFAATVVYGGYVQYRTAAMLGPARWNPEPIGLDIAPSRIWDWQDLQFMRPDEFEGEITTALRIWPGSRFGFSRKLAGVGWSFPEHNSFGQSYTWMAQRNATLNIEVPQKVDLQVSFRVIDWLSDATLNSLALYIDDTKVPLTRVFDDEGAAVYEGLLPAEAFTPRQRYYVLTFAVDHTLSPTVKFPESTDARKLGLAFDWIDFQLADEAD